MLASYSKGPSTSQDAWHLTEGQEALPLIQMAFLSETLYAQHTEHTMILHPHGHSEKQVTLIIFPV